MRLSAEKMVASIFLMMFFSPLKKNRASRDVLGQLGAEKSFCLLDEFSTSRRVGRLYFVSGVVVVNLSANWP